MVFKLFYFPQFCSLSLSTTKTLPLSSPETQQNALEADLGNITSSSKGFKDRNWICEIILLGNYEV